jgi:hypothetical protein
MIRSFALDVTSANWLRFVTACPDAPSSIAGARLRAADREDIPAIGFGRRNPAGSACPTRDWVRSVGDGGRRGHLGFVRPGTGDRSQRGLGVVISGDDGGGWVRSALWDVLGFARRDLASSPRRPPARRTDGPPKRHPDYRIAAPPRSGNPIPRRLTARGTGTDRDPRESPTTTRSLGPTSGCHWLCHCRGRALAKPVAPEDRTSFQCHPAV